ncbi:MAG: MCE family protein [Verrucomicrobiae bacterium]|nr:MCE family protein [Verrucomicrobiae bacterium]
MNKKVSPALIGAFILTGTTLAVAALVILTSGRLFRHQERMILYFDTSMKGLQEGAPVKWRGVTIGSVAEVLIRHNQAPDDFSNPVIIQVDGEILRRKSDDRMDLDDPAFLKTRIAQGLRGKLDAESLVTGVLYVELGMVTNAPPAIFHQLRAEYPEIPTMPTGIQELLANLAQVDFRGISERMSALLTRVDSLLGAIDMHMINEEVTRLLSAANGLVASPDLTNSLHELNLALGDARVLIRGANVQMDTLTGSVTNTLAEADRALLQMRRGLEALTGMVEPDAPFRSDATMALGQVADAAQALAELADFLRRNPNALLTGRKPPTPKP